MCDAVLKWHVTVPAKSRTGLNTAHLSVITNVIERTDFCKLLKPVWLLAIVSSLAQIFFYGLSLPAIVGLAWILPLDKCLRMVLTA
jgi:hypothetical protein